MALLVVCALNFGLHTVQGEDSIKVNQTVPLSSPLDASGYVGVRITKKSFFQHVCALLVNIYKFCILHFVGLGSEHSLGEDGIYRVCQ